MRNWSNGWGYKHAIRMIQHCSENAMSCVNVAKNTKPIYLRSILLFQFEFLFNWADFFLSCVECSVYIVFFFVDVAEHWALVKYIPLKINFVPVIGVACHSKHANPKCIQNNIRFTIASAVHKAHATRINKHN